MAGNAGKNQSIRFGPFVADLHAGELLKNGRRIPLQEQPFQVLAALIERPGEVVAREDLRERLWPGQPFVDFDQGLNTAINKIRDALGDSAANPRFVETLPRRGYRFTFPVDPPEPPPPIASPAPTATEGRQGPFPLRKTVVALAGACLLLTGTSMYLWLRQPQPSSELPLRRFAVRAPLTRNLRPFNRRASISPDGTSIAFVNDDSRLWVWRFDQDQPYPVEGSERAAGPFWSPDSKMIGFAAGGGLKRVSATGGAIGQIAGLRTIVFFGAAWSVDGQAVVFSDGQQLNEAPAGGGTPRLVFPGKSSPLPLPRPRSDGKPDRGYLFNPQFLPEEAGRRVIVFSVGFESSQLVILDLGTGRTEPLGVGRFPSYSTTGHLLFQSEADFPDIWAQPLSLKRLTPAGSAFRIARNGSEVSVSADGTLAYVDSLEDSERLVWLDRAGGRLAGPGPPRLRLHYPAISPDGKSVAVETLQEGNLDLWVNDIARGSRIRLTADPATDLLPVWSPDGEWIAYTSGRTGAYNIFLRRSDASAEDEVLTSGKGYQRVSDWSADGQRILFYEGDAYFSREGRDPNGSSSLQYLERNATGGWDAHVFLRSPHSLRAPKLSPDGKRLAYLSNESGRYELHVRPFPQGEGQWVVSRNGAAQPRWNRNGRELFYVERDTLMAVPVQTTGGFVAGPPAPLFTHPNFGLWLDPNYDVSPGGDRFLLPERFGGGEAASTLRVVQNWFAEFRTAR
ncbi:MAG: PD40 domain-containing protein [Bryobacteraceae bacterium]|nr:PD40 domain-containing protein [Bryobacteraceae bacterium]